VPWYNLRCLMPAMPTNPPTPVAAFLHNTVPPSQKSSFAYPRLERITPPRSPFHDGTFFRPYHVSCSNSISPPTVQVKTDLHFLWAHSFWRLIKSSLQKGQKVPSFRPAYLDIQHFRSAPPIPLWIAFLHLDTSVFEWACRVNGAVLQTHA
jgi:hypothetical protein